VVGSTYHAPSATAQAYYYKELDRKRQEQEERNAQIIAQRNAEQQARQNAENQARVRTAFDQTYGPQLQRAYQDTAVQSAPTNSPAGRARDLAIGHGFTSGGTVGQPGTDITAFAAGKLPQPTMAPNQLQNTLDYMWRQQTDPYQRTANQMGGMMTLFHPSDAPAREWGAAVRGSGGGGTPKKKKSAVEPEGIDWWKQQNEGGALMR
jgi:hypothetical protein